MRKILMAAFIGLVVIGVVTVIASIVVPMMTPTPTLDEPVAIIGGAEAPALLDDLYALDNHGLWVALGIAGGIVAVIGGVPLILMAVLKKVK